MTKQITSDEVRELRMEIGRGVMRAQAKFNQYGPDQLIPEILAGLLSLAANVARKNANLSISQFRQACDMAAQERWPS